MKMKRSEFIELLKKKLDFLNTDRTANILFTEDLQQNDIYNLFFRVFSTGKFKARQDIVPIGSHKGEVSQDTLLINYKIGPEVELYITIKDDSIRFGADSKPDGSWVLHIEIAPEVIITFRYQEDDHTVKGICFLTTFIKNKSPVLYVVYLISDEGYNVLQLKSSYQDFSVD
jgi:hypothetical protein